MSEFFFKGTGKTGKPIKGEWDGRHYVYTDKKSPKKRMKWRDEPSASSDVTKDNVGDSLPPVASPNPNRTVPKRLRLSPYMSVSSRSQRQRDAHGNITNPARHWLRANEEASRGMTSSVLRAQEEATRSELSTETPEERPAGPDPVENPILAAMMAKRTKTKKSLSTALFVYMEEE